MRFHYNCIQCNKQINSKLKTQKFSCCVTDSGLSFMHIIVFEAHYNQRLLYFRKPRGILPIETLTGHEFTVCILKVCFFSMGELIIGTRTQLTVCEKNPWSRLGRLRVGIDLVTLYPTVLPNSRIRFLV